MYSFQIIYGRKTVTLLQNLTSPSKLDVASKLGGHDTTDKMSSLWPFVCSKIDDREEVRIIANKCNLSLKILEFT